MELLRDREVLRHTAARFGEVRLYRVVCSPLEELGIEHVKHLGVSLDRRGQVGTGQDYVRNVARRCMPADVIAAPDLLSSAAWPRTGSARASLSPSTAPV